MYAVWIISWVLWTHRIPKVLFGIWNRSSIINDTLIQFTVFWIIDIGSLRISNTDTRSVNAIRIRAEAKQRINEVCCSRGAPFIYLYISLCLIKVPGLFLLSQTLLTFVSMNVESRMTIVAIQTLQKKLIDRKLILRVKTQENTIYSMFPNVNCLLFAFEMQFDND